VLLLRRRGATRSGDRGGRGALPRACGKHDDEQQSFVELRRYAAAAEPSHLSRHSAEEAARSSSSARDCRQAPA
jgi:hypothetical protein